MYFSFVHPFVDFFLLSLTISASSYSSLFFCHSFSAFFIVLFLSHFSSYTSLFFFFSFFSQFLRRVNHPDSGDSWGTSRASLKTSKHRTTQRNGENSPKFDGISPPRRRAISPKNGGISPKNGGISPKRVIDGSGDSAPKSVSSTSTASNIPMGLGSIYSKPSPFLGEWPIFSNPLGYASNEKNRLSKKYYDIGLGFSGGAESSAAKSNKDMKPKDGSDENTKEKNNERTKSSTKSCQSTSVLSDKDIENYEVLSENEPSNSDKVIFKEGNIYKKNSTGFFRNWKRVHFRITKRFMRWGTVMNVSLLFLTLLMFKTLSNSSVLYLPT